MFKISIVHTKLYNSVMVSTNSVYWFQTPMAVCEITLPSENFKIPIAFSFLSLMIP